MLHIVGAGLAGLACAVEAAAAGLKLRLYEAAPQAGGRCRSLEDASLGRRIDNGSHLLLGAYRATFAYLDRIGARARLVGIEPAGVPFLDLSSGVNWRVSGGPKAFMRALSGQGLLVPGGRFGDLARLARLLLAGENDTVADALGPDGALYRKLWRPLTVGALNTRPEEASARLLWPVVRRTLLGGAAASRAYVAPDGLSAALIEPAVEWLAARGATLRLGARASAFDWGDGRLRSFDLGGEKIALDANDALVLAVPPAAANALVPGLSAPEESRAIVNAHFRLDREVALPGGAPLLGLLGGEAEWLFARGDVVSVTVSAADTMAGAPSDDIAKRLWRDVARALGLSETPVPPVRVLKEKRATPAQTPAFARSRPGTATRWKNLFLAGDWIATGLPATIESAIASGQATGRAVATR